MDPNQYQLPPWLFAQGAPYSPQTLDASGITGGIPAMYGQPSGPAMLNSTQFPTNMQTTSGTGSGMDAQKWASILGALAPMASRGQQGGSGYMRAPEAMRTPGDPNYRPTWQLQFTPGQGLQMLSPMMRRR